MNGGVTVVLCIVGALVLCEAILPRVLAILRRRRQERAKAEMKTSVDVPRAAFPVPRAEDEAVVRCPSSSVREGDSGQRTTDSGQRRNARRTTHDEPDAKREARAEGEDLAETYAAAMQGNPEAMLELGNYAYWRGAIVEAFYWTILAELKGMAGLDEVLFEMRTRWLAEGCPPEFENAYAEFTEEQGEFARAVLCLQCDVNPQYASIRLDELADAGNEDARLFVQVAKEEVES